MVFGDMLSFRKDLFFEGAVQADWFYQPEKAALVAKNFVFHGSEYYGIGEVSGSQKFTDTIHFAKDIAQKVYEDQPANSLTLAIAGYGTGKSHLAVTLATLLSGKDYQRMAYLQIIQNIKGIDAKSAAEIQSYTQRPNLVLVLNGMRDFNLHYELLKTAQKSLKLYGCDDTNLKKLNRAIETAFRFFARNAVSMRASFEAVAPRFGYSEQGDALLEKIRQNLGEDEAAFDIINAVYEDLNGHAIRWDEGISASAVLETLMTEYCGISGPFSKIILIFDEFGRYLEYASSTTTAHSGDSALQQIFECVQNYGGNLQVINFIQSDIKAYLQRVDQSTNISRYIGRYDASEKYRLSSNLETIFANLIERKDKALFDSTVISWQNSCESQWKEVFDSINNWLSTVGVWRDYKLFRKVAVEGIYPLHPLSTYMLTKLSDYLQNRSSLMLLSRYIADFAKIALIPGQPAPLVLPEMLLKGDLFTEMLAAEEEGRQVSQHCIRLNNVLRKYEDKLSENSRKVLRANLALRILRCRTTNYDDALKGLAMFSGLAEDEVKNELFWLENEYAVLGYDEHAACFDFLEDSSGAHDFKTHFRRLRATVQYNDSILEDAKIRELAEIIEPLNTNYAVKHKISTNEWQFVQELIPITDLSETLIRQWRSDWQNTISCTKAKGRLIWLYSNNETPEEAFERAQKYTTIVDGTPIILMLIKDTEGLLQSALCDYLTLQAMSDSDQKKYGRHYFDKIEQTENNIQQSFERLKKERLQITKSGIIPFPSRITSTLTAVFEQIYPKAVPFDFDGFANKQLGKARKAFCSIVRLILSGQISENTIHSFPSDVRNRFEATLFVKGAASWKVINEDYQIIPPMNKAALAAYNAIVEDLPEGESIQLSKVIDMLAMPPYGMNDYEAVYMIATVFANLSYCLRASYKGQILTVNKWKDHVISDSKIELAAIRATTAKRINAGAVTDQFLALFNRINANTDTKIAKKLNDELNTMLRSENIPDALSAQLQLAKSRIQEGARIQQNWDGLFEQAMQLYEKLLIKQDFYSGLQSLQMFKDSTFYNVFLHSNYSMSEEQSQMLRSNAAEIKAQIDPYLMGWISRNHCDSVENIGLFKKYMNRLVNLLNSLGYTNEAASAEAVAEKEVSNRKAIKERQEIKQTYHHFIENNIVTESTAYTHLIDWKATCEKIASGIEQHKYYLGSDLDSMRSAIKARLSEIVSRIDQIKDRMNSIYDLLYSISSVEDIYETIDEIKKISLCGISEQDMEDFNGINGALSGVLSDIETMMEEQNNRERFRTNYAELRQKYEEAEEDFDVLSVLEGVANSIQEELDRKDQLWSDKHLTDVPNSISAMHTWLQDTETLPNYLSDSSSAAYARKKATVELKLSAAKVDDIVLRFQNLSGIEKQSCYSQLTALIQPDSV